MSIDPRQLCQIEIQVSDLERSLRFYAHVFGWTPVPADLHEYTVLAVPRDCPFGISLVVNPLLSSKSATQTGQLVLYFGVVDPEVLAEKAVQAGGAKRFGPQKIGGYGEIYQVSDPDGLRFGLYRRKDVPFPGR